MKAFDKAEKAGYSAPAVQLQRAGIYRSKGELKEARGILGKLEELSKYNAEYHFQLAGLSQAEGERWACVRSQSALRIGYQVQQATAPTASSAPSA